MKKLLALLVGLLIIGTTAGIAGAADTTKIPEYALYIEEKPVKIIEKDGIITIANAEGINKKILIEQIRRQIAMRHMEDITSKANTPLALVADTKSDADGNQRPITLPAVGEVYIGAYAEETVRREAY